MYIWYLVQGNKNRLLTIGSGFKNWMLTNLASHWYPRLDLTIPLFSNESQQQQKQSVMNAIRVFTIGALEKLNLHFQYLYKSVCCYCDPQLQATKNYLAGIFMRFSVTMFRFVTDLSF